MTTVTHGDDDNGGGASNKEEEDMGSSDEALCEMLGIPSLSMAKEDANSEASGTAETSTDADALDPPRESLDDLLRLDTTWIQAQVRQHELEAVYLHDSVCILPDSLRVPESLMRKLTDELVWGGNEIQADKSYETIRVLKQGEILERKTLTRLENFTNHHAGWHSLCNDYIRRCVSAVTGQEMVLYKTKLNLKPAGGSGFAPHVDAPSLLTALGEQGPQTFCTVMVAIDNATTVNGCLRICKGKWNNASCQVVPPDVDGNPDAGGRAGAIPLDIANDLEFTDITCRGGTIATFTGWAPHRSGANKSPFARRAVFLTYNPASEGDWHDAYYEKMEAMRNEWKNKVGLAPPTTVTQDEERDLEALNTIPK